MVMYLADVATKLYFDFWGKSEKTGSLPDFSATQPDKQAYSELLKKAASEGDIKLVGYLCELESDVQPDQQSVNSALLTAAEAWQWDVVEYLCKLQTINKPNQDSVNQVFKRAVYSGHSKVAVTLCAMTGDNKPDNTTIEYGFEAASRSMEKRDLLVAIYNIATDNKPSQKSINKQFVKMFECHDWKTAAQMCDMQGGNKPDSEAIKRALRQATLWEQIDLVNTLFAMQTRNHPNQKAVIPEFELALLNTNLGSAPWGIEPIFSKMAGENKTDEVALPGDKRAPIATFMEESKAEPNGLEKVSQFEALCVVLEEKEREARRIAQEAATSKAEEEAARKAQEEAARKAQEEVARKAQEEVARKAQEEIARKVQEEVARKLQEEIARKVQEEVARKLQEEVVRKEQIAAARKALEEKRIVHQNFIKEVMTNIDKTFEDFEEKIKSVEHCSDDAIKLLHDLKSAQQEYKTQLNQAKVAIPKANHAFKKQCKKLIEDAKPVLERDLGFGDILVNLLVEIGNAILWGMSVGYADSFFKPVQSESLQAAQKMEGALLQPF